MAVLEQFLPLKVDPILEELFEPWNQIGAL